MRRKAPHVRDYMTRIPVEVERCETVADAIATMAEHDIHHIPVMSGSHLRGIVSERDILRARIEYGDAVDNMPLESVYQADVLCVGPMTPIDEVARRMLGRSVGSVVIVDGGFVVGIFTTTDALRALLAVFEGNPPAGGERGT